jgi:MarR family transcriptional regulator, organic hydroperoxide resistance regulator
MDADEMLILDRQVCFALYSASRAFTNRYRPLLGELGLTYPQYLVMLVLWEREPISVKELGARLRLDSGTLSPLLKRLVAAGLITKTRCDEDERSVRVTLTTAGQELRTRAREVPSQMLCSTGLDLDELDRLRATLNLLTAAVDQAAAGTSEGTTHA